MRIAIPINGSPSASPETGGGYALENELISALLQLDIQLDHEFWIYCLNAQENQRIQPIDVDLRNIKIIAQKPSFYDRLRLEVRRNKDAVIRKIRQPNISFKREELLEVAMKESLLREQIDLVWAFSPFHLKMDFPYVITIWDLQHRLQPFFPEVSAWQAWINCNDFYTIALQRATHVIVGTERGKQEVEQFYQVDSDRIKVLPFPTPMIPESCLNASGDEVLKKYQLTKPYLFYPAQFWPHKNHITILYALDILRKNHQIEIDVVFSGSDKQNCRYIQDQVTALGLTHQVHFLGFIPRLDVLLLYKQAFALLYLSLFGPDNLPPLEAFCLHCPVIAAEVPGTREQLGDAAILVNPRDEVAVAQAIQNLLIDPALRNQMIEKGAQRSRQWTAKDYILGVNGILNEFAKFRRCWR